MIYAAGDDGNIQAGVEWPAQRFTDNGDGDRNGQSDRADVAEGRGLH